MITRETIYAALFAKAQTVSGIKTCSRRLQHWTDLSAAQQPALFQAQRGETAERQNGAPAKWLIEVDWYLYVNAGGSITATPSTALNSLLDAIEAALAPLPVAQMQTLGGLVRSCWISGKIETDEGTLGAQAVAIIPISLLAV